MSVDVRQQLDRLAQDAPTGVAPSDLWQRGVRRRRRRLAGGVAASVLAVLVGGGLAGAIVSVTPRPTVAPAATDGAAIPRAVIVPDPWTPGTDREGPPGRLAVVLGAERMTGWGNSSDGLVGVSATTGEYRFLDLPGRLLGSSGEDNPAEVLSPDGRTVAYWMMGDNERLGGIAAYDTVTGEVTRQPLPSSLGIEPVVMRWTDSSTVLLQYANVTQRSDNTSSGTVTALYAWTPRTGDLVLVPGTKNATVERVATAPSGFVTFGAGTLRSWSPSLQVRGRFTLSGLRSAESVNDLRVSPDGRTVALTALPDVRTDQTVGRLLVGRLPTSTSGTVRLREVPTDAAVERVVGWRDASHVVAMAGLEDRTGAFSVETTTGRARQLLSRRAAAVHLERAVRRGPVGPSARRPAAASRRPGPPGRGPRRRCRRARAAGPGRRRSAHEETSWRRLSRSTRTSPRATRRCCGRRTCSPATTTTPRTSCRPRWSRPWARGSGSRTARTPTCAGSWSTRTSRAGAATRAARC